MWPWPVWGALLKSIVHLTAIVFAQGGLHGPGFYYHNWPLSLQNAPFPLTRLCSPPLKSVLAVSVALCSSSPQCSCNSELINRVVPNGCWHTLPPLSPAAPSDARHCLLFLIRLVHQQADGDVYALGSDTTSNHTYFCPRSCCLKHSFAYYFIS